MTTMYCAWLHAPFPSTLQALVKAEYDLPRYQNGLIDPEDINKHKKSLWRSTRGWFTIAIYFAGLHIRMSSMILKKIKIKLHNNVYEYTFYGLHMALYICCGEVRYNVCRVKDQFLRPCSCQSRLRFEKGPLKPIDRFGDMDTLTKSFASIWKRVYSETK